MQHLTKSLPRPTTDQLPPALEEAFLHFLNTTHPGELRDNLFCLLFDYLIDHHDALPKNFNHSLENIYNLFILLNSSAGHAHRWHSPESA
jgi:hypothetical protein